MGRRLQRPKHPRCRIAGDGAMPPRMSSVCQGRGYESTTGREETAGDTGACASADAVVAAAQMGELRKNRGPVRRPQAERQVHVDCSSNPPASHSARSRHRRRGTVRHSPRVRSNRPTRRLCRVQPCNARIHGKIYCSLRAPAHVSEVPSPAPHGLAMIVGLNSPITPSDAIRPRHSFTGDPSDPAARTDGRGVGRLAGGYAVMG